MKAVRSALGNEVHSRTCGESELGKKCASIDLELLDRFDVQRRTKQSRSVLMLSTVNCQQVRMTVSAADRESRAWKSHSRILRARRFGVAHSGQDEDIGSEIAADI